MNTAHPLRLRGRTRGLSLVELMIGMALGLLIVAAGLLAFTHHLRETRSLVLEARLMQDLRTTTELITRDLRRAGHWAGAASGAWHASASAPLANPYQHTTLSGGTVVFHYSRDTHDNHRIDSHEHFGYRLRAGAIDMQMGEGRWQALTDSDTLQVTALSITKHHEPIPLAAWCAQPCPEGHACPTQMVQRFDVRLSGHARNDKHMSRSLHTSVRLRNDTITGACPT
jgi:prepilin peptidase dependent protein B